MDAQKDTEAADTEENKCGSCQCDEKLSQKDCGILHPNISQQGCSDEKSMTYKVEKGNGDAVPSDERCAASNNRDSDDDFLDAIVMAEEGFQEYGFKQGYALGERSGFEDGRQTGHVKGREVGSEIGFYSGFASMWKALLEKQTDKPRPRVKKALETLLAMIKEFPLDNPNHEGLWEDLKKIRAKFKQLASLLNVTIDASDGNTKPAMSF